ncbi:MAG: class I SAM-dependent methyltransferase [candidate division Zixibacteria bacterium]|nr:class I SAM-dependent methyltransferase [candidate division Zixibacteria bacterium]
MSRKELYKEKDNNYYGLIRHDLIQMIEGSGNKILDIGCGEGQTGWTLKKSGKAKEVVGVELIEGPAKRAEIRLDRVIHGDVEEITLSFEPGYFDYIILADVVEHLIDPWRVIKQLSRFLSREGFLVASIPNVKYWRVLMDLIVFDRWTYHRAGILDKGHLRFFTYTTMAEMFKTNGFELKEIKAKKSTRLANKLFNRATFGIFEKFLVPGYLVKAQRKVR